MEVQNQRVVPLSFLFLFLHNLPFQSTHVGDHTHTCASVCLLKIEHVFWDGKGRGGHKFMSNFKGYNGALKSTGEMFSWD